MKNNRATTSMANKLFLIFSSRSRSPILLFTICPFACSLLSYSSLSTRHPSASPHPDTIPNLSLKPETSFVAALEHFLHHKYTRSSSSSPFPTDSEEDVPRFDDQVFPKRARMSLEAMNWVRDQPAWKRSEGRNHIFPIHHPWSFKSVCRYVKNPIWLLPDMDSTGNW